VKRALAVLAAAMLVTLSGATSAWAQPEPVDLVHSERVPLASSTLTVSFGDWPIRSYRSMDFTFEPDGGIEGRTGLLRVVSPSGDAQAFAGAGLQRRGEAIVLPRHPRARDVWGLDVVALPEEGTWRFEFTVDGPEGPSQAVLPLQVGPAPGPPMALSWTVAMLPWTAVVPLLVYLWVRSRPRRSRMGSTAWSG
jgi:hypothetical protein